MLCLAGLLSFPVMSLQAASVTMTETGGTMLLKADDSTVKQVFDYIERHSKYVFVYDQKVKTFCRRKSTFKQKESLWNKSCLTFVRRSVLNTKSRIVR